MTISIRTTCLALAAVFLLAGSASASTIAANSVSCCSTGGSSFALGQAVTTPLGGPWNSLAFNLVDSSGAPYANGSLYLLTQVYSGAAAGLSSGTAGFLASTSNTAGGVWTFASGVTLQANTAYWFYMNTFFNGSVQVMYSTSNPYPGGAAYQQDDSGYPGYTVFSGNDLAFSLQGTQSAAVPEPTTWVLLGTGLAVVAARRRFAKRT